MRGTVLDFSIQTNLGFISADNGKRYQFNGSDWNLTTMPVKGDRVDFDVDGNKAFAIYAEPNDSSKMKTKKSKITAGILALLLGGLGVHYFYLGSWGWGIISILFCWTYIPALVSLVFGVHYLMLSDEQFACKMNKSQDPFYLLW